MGGKGVVEVKVRLLLEAQTGPKERNIAAILLVCLKAFELAWKIAARM
jgi:hypothetical protein